MAAPPPPSGAPHRKVWRRVLYERQVFPDDHVDDTFLQTLVTNANARAPDYWSQVRRTFGLVERVCLVVLFFVRKQRWAAEQFPQHTRRVPPPAATQILFFKLHLEQISLPAFFFIDAVLMVCLAGAALLGVHLSPEGASAGPGAAEHSMQRSILRLFKYTAVFLGVLFALSPVLRTLTSSYSNDTMWALTIGFAGMHVLLHDYAHPPNTPQYAGATALNAAMFAAILLASRLSSSQHVLALVACAIGLFGVWPHALQAAKASSRHGTALVGTLLLALDCGLLATLAPALALVLGVSMASTALLSPLALSWLRPLKHEIAGPWDIARPTTG